ncbi:MAG: histidine kinase [Rudanella sp.]|nr:histidine kinase [Rudanella sp.]
MPFCLPLWLLLALLVTAPAAGQSVVQPLLPLESLLMQEPVESLADPTNQLTVADVGKRSGLLWKRTRGQHSFGMGSVHWLRVRVTNRSARPLALMATLNNFYVDVAHFYIVFQTGRLEAESGPLDWTIVTTRRPNVHRDPCFQFIVPPGQTRWVYAKAGTFTQPLLVGLQVRTVRQFTLDDRSERLFWNWVFGIMFWMIVMGAILGFLMKERVYGFYSLNIMGVSIYLMGATGFLPEWLLIVDSGVLPVRYLITLLTFSSVLFSFLFIRVYVLLPFWHRLWVRRLFYGILVPIVSMMLLICIEPFSNGRYDRQMGWMTPLASLSYVLPILIMFSLVIWCARRESRKERSIWLAPAQLYLLSLTPIVAHSVLTVLNNYTIITYPIARHEGIALAYLIEFVLLSVGLGARYKNMTDDRQRLARQSLEQQLQLQQQHNQALQAQLRLQQEKERIARDLHDNVGAQLSVIASSLDYVRMTHPLNGSATRLEDIGTYARDAIGSLRETIWAINREQITLDEYRLQLQQYLSRQQTLIPTSRFRLQADLSDPHSNRPAPVVWLSSEQALGLFRIAQEAVQNAVKHARASQITVRIDTQAEHGLCLSVEDDGVGFDPAAEHPGHYGMLNMRLRAERMGGQWSVTSAPGRGTTLFLTLPLKNTEVYV